MSNYNTYPLHLQDFDQIEEITIIMQLTPVLGSFLQITEFICYLTIYIYIYKHNHSMAKNSVISFDIYKSRQKRNTFTLSGQVACFLMEELFLVHLLVLNAFGYGFSSKEISFAMRVPQFALQTILQISTSRDIRVKLISFIKKKKLTVKIVIIATVTSILYFK